MTYPLGVWQAMITCVYVADKVRLGDSEFVSTARLAYRHRAPPHSSDDSPRPD
jgi:hypothetical protein